MHSHVHTDVLDINILAKVMQNFRNIIPDIMLHTLFDLILELIDTPFWTLIICKAKLDLQLAC